MFPGRRPTAAGEPRSGDHRKQMHHLNSDPETDKLAGLGPTADEGFRVWKSASFIQLVVAGSQGLTDPQAWPVSGLGRAVNKECGAYIYAHRNWRPNQYRKQPLESGSETMMISILLLWTPSLKYCSKLKGEYKNLKSGSGTSVGHSLSPLGLSLKTILVTLSL